MTAEVAVAVVVAVGVVFYLIVPGLGAFSARSRWRRFRAAVIEALAAPALTDMPGAPVPARLVGTLEATEGDDTLWIRSGSIAAAVPAGAVPIHLVPSGLKVGMAPHLGRPESVYWAELSAMAEGTPFMVYGQFVPEAAGLRLSATAVSPLILAFDDRTEEIGLRCIWAGRQGNEFWNHFTTPSLVVGFLALLLLALRVLTLSRGLALLAITAAMVPVLPLFPPGVAGLYLFRQFWGRGRRYRAIRDVLNAPDAVNAVCNRQAWPPAFIAADDAQDNPVAIDLRGLAEAYRDPGRLWFSARPHLAALRTPSDAEAIAARYGLRAALLEISGSLILLLSLLLNCVLVLAALNAITGP